MNDIVTNDAAEFFDMLTQLGNFHGGFAFQWGMDSNGIRLPIYVFCNA